MKRQSYRIKHDFLFDEEDTPIIIPSPNPAIACHATITVSNILVAKSKEAFDALIDGDNKDVVIVDDIGNCLNPASERYKQFIVRCVCRKLHEKNISIYR